MSLEARNKCMINIIIQKNQLNVVRFNCTVRFESHIASMDSTLGLIRFWTLQLQLLAFLLVCEIVVLKFLSGMILEKKS